MLNRELEVTLNLAFKEARAKRHEFMTVEHLLLALLDNEAAATVLRACGANLDKLRRDLQEFIDSTTPLIPQHDDERETQPTLGFQGFKAPLKKLRAIGNTYPNYIQVVASQASGIKTLADLKGKRISVGAPKSGTELNARAIFKLPA